MLAHRAETIHPAAREALAGLPRPPEAKIAKEDDCDFNLNMAPPVTLQLEDEEGAVDSMGRT